MGPDSYVRNLKTVSKLSHNFSEDRVALPPRNLKAVSQISHGFSEDRVALPPRNLEAVSKLSRDLGIHLQSPLIVRNNSSLARAW